MPNLHPAPSAEDIDEPAVRRSIRVNLIVLSAVFLSSALAGFLVFRSIDRTPTGVEKGFPAWGVVLLVAWVGIILAASMWWVSRLYRRPAYRRVMQYGWSRRRHVVKALLRGRAISATDMPVAKAIVDLQRSQGRWLMILFSVLPFISVFNGFIQQGPLRWFQFGVAAYLVVFLPFIVLQRRRIIRNYERLLKGAK